MGGHNKWSQIKRQKGATDAAKSNIWGKLSRRITIESKKAGGDVTLPALRAVIDKAKSVNMPKENIDRAINAAAKANENLEEVTYEGFGPGGIGVIVEAATNNRNRTGQELKNMMEKVGGSMAGPGAVAFNFDPKGLILVAKKNLKKL